MRLTRKKLRKIIAEETHDLQFGGSGEAQVPDLSGLDLSDETAGLRAPSFDTLERELFQASGEIRIRVVDTDGDNQGTLSIDVSDLAIGGLGRGNVPDEAGIGAELTVGASELNQYDPYAPNIAFLVGSALANEYNSPRATDSYLINFYSYVAKVLGLDLKKDIKKIQKSLTQALDAGVKSGILRIAPPDAPSSSRKLSEARSMNRNQLRRFIADVITKL
mgnify:CR=1 FL=1